MFEHALNGNVIGAPTQLTSPAVAARAFDKWVLAIGNRIVVIRDDGMAFAHDVAGSVVSAAYDYGEVPAIRNAPKAVVAMTHSTLGQRLLVVAANGAVVAHSVGATLGSAVPIGGAPVATLPEDKWVVAMGDHLVVVNQFGKAFAHEIADGVVGARFELNNHGAPIAARPQDQWVFAMGSRLTIVTKQRWQFFAGMSGADPIWREDEALAKPLPPFGVADDGFHECLGYFNVRFVDVLNRWAMVYTCNADAAVGFNPANGPRGVYIRTSSTPWGPWTNPQIVLDAADGYCYLFHNQRSDSNDECSGRGLNPFEESVRDTDFLPGDGTNRAWGAEYAPILLPPRYAKAGPTEATIYYMLSTWNPYQVVLMKTQVSRIQ